MNVIATIRSATIWHQLDLFSLRWGSAARAFLFGAIFSKLVDLIVSGELPSVNARWSMSILAVVVFIVLPGAMWVLAKIADQSRELSRVGTLLNDVPFFGADKELFEELGRGKLVVGTAVTVSIAPRLGLGWLLKDVRLSQLDNAAAEPPPIDDNDGKKIAIRRVGLAGSDIKVVQLEYEVTRHSTIQAARAVGATEKLLSLSQLDTHQFSFPGSFCIHAIVITEDGDMLLTRRSAALSYYPNAWSASLEEQLTCQDIGDPVSDDAGLARAVKRMLDEELGLRVDAEHEERSPFVRITSVKCLAIFAEADIPNISAVVYVPLAMNSARLRRWLNECPRPDHEFTDYLLLDRKAIALELARGANLHPTSRYRMVLALYRLVGGKEANTLVVQAARGTEVAATALRDAERARRLAPVKNLA
jgi:hypothetical protein